MEYQFIIFVLGLASAKRGRPTNSEVTEATTTSATSEDDDYMILVKSYIDAGTCGEVSSSSLCGDDATSYYKEFEYLGNRVVITNSIPDHEAESDALNPNPNTR